MAVRKIAQYAVVIFLVTAPIVGVSILSFNGEECKENTVECVYS